MATLNFPDSPDTGDIYFDSNSGFTYEWNGTVWISRDPSTIPNIKELDNISGSFNGSTTTFNLTSSSAAVTPATAQQLVINIGNVMQNPGDDYTVSGSTITFTTAPLAGYAFQGTVLGSGVSLGTVVDGSVSPSSLDTSDSYNVGGITVTGITTVTDFTLSGITTVANLEPADVKVSGIGTVSNIIMTKDAAGLGATMGAAVGVVTYYGDGSNLTGLGLTFFPISYDPGISSTSIPVSTNITLDWNHPIKAGSGTITIRSGSASGTVVDQFVVGSSSSITISNNQLILNPAANLSLDTEYFVTLPAGSIKSYGDKYQNDQLIYSFTTLVIKRFLFMAGYNDAGQLGMNNRTQYSSPCQIGTPSDYTWAKMATCGESAQTHAATKTDGTLWVWGRGTSGEMGNNAVVSHSSPVQVPGTTWGTSEDEDGKIICSYAGVGAIKTDGTLWMWGASDNQGILGLNSPSNSAVSSPTQVGTDTTWKSLAACQYSCIATKTNGTLWSWGSNLLGSLAQNQSSGNPTYNYENGRSSPTQIGTGTDWDRVISHGYAVKTDGSLWKWGNNYNGNLGLNQNYSELEAASSPCQIPGTTWPAAASGSGGSNGSTSIKTDGTLWMWGTNYHGCYGANVPMSTTNGQVFSSPVQIPGTTWKQVQRGTSRTTALKTDGTLWYTGDRWAGLTNPGQSVPGSQSSPVQIGTETDWIELGEGELYLGHRALKDTGV